MKPRWKVNTNDAPALKSVGIFPADFARFPPATRRAQKLATTPTCIRERFELNSSPVSS